MTDLPGDQSSDDIDNLGAPSDPTPEKGERPEWADGFLETLANVGVVKRAAELTGIHRSTPYDLAERDPVFAKQLQDARKAAKETLIGEAWRRAVEGWEEPRWFEGEYQGVVRRYDGTLLMFLIKQADPSYRDSVKVQHSGDPENPVAFAIDAGPEALDAARALRDALARSSAA